MNEYILIFTFIKFFASKISEETNIKVAVRIRPVLSADYGNNIVQAEGK